jgi:hypothetical protein
MGSVPGGMEALCAKKKKKKKSFILGRFYISLNLEVGEDLCHSLSNGEDLGGFMHTPMLILRYNPGGRKFPLI